MKMNDAKQPLSAAQEMQRRSAEARWRNVSPEQRSEMMAELGRRGGKATGGKVSPKQRSEMMRKLARRRWAAAAAENKA